MPRYQKIKKYYKKEQFLTLEESLEFVCAKLHRKISCYYIKIKTYKPEIIKNARVGVKLKNFIKFCLKISKHLLKLCYTFLKIS